MRKKKCLEYPAPDGNVVLHGHNTGHERHNILDIRDHRGHVYRCILTKDNYATWDYIEEKWTRKEALELDYSDANMTEKDKKKIWDFARKQRRIRAKREERSSKQRKKQRETDFRLIPLEPEDFADWLIDQYGSYLYYRKKGSGAHVTCARCGAEYDYRFAGRWKSGPEPIRNRQGTCRVCHTEGTWAPEGRVRNRRINAFAWLIQNMPDGRLCARMYYYACVSYGGQRDRIDIGESMRIFMGPGGITKYFHLWNPWTGCAVWSRSNIAGYGSIREEKGPFYPGWEKAVEASGMRYCDLNEWSRHLPIRMSMEEKTIRALTTHAKCPQTEFLLKAGATKLALQIGAGWSVSLDRKAHRPDKFLRLDPQRARELISANWGCQELRVLQMEMAAGTRWSEEEREFMRLIDSHMGKKEIEELFGIMSLKKLYNRVEKYKKEYSNSQYTALIELRDYLFMRRELGYDMENSVFLNPRSLREAHMEMVAEREQRRTDHYIRGKMAEYPHIRENYPRLKRKYGWRYDGLVIRPAKDAEEIIMEGRNQHHCVGGDMYLRRHDRGESTILLLREEDLPNMPYITVEIKQGRIAQWYGAHDKKPDQERIDAWLAMYVGQLRPAAKEDAASALQMA